MRLAVNFFGHAVVAYELNRAPRFVLGAMLPDFEGMLGSPPIAFRDAVVDAGRRCHHVTDAAFHSGPFFLEHQRAAREWLARTPLGRGQRRAVSHVGVELILDAALLRPARLRAYRAAVASGLTATGAPDLSCAARLNLNTLLTALMARGSHVVALDPDEVAPRLERALSRRPALRLVPSELPLVNAWANTAWRPIHAQAEAWLEHLLLAVRATLSSSVSPLADRVRLR